jgi:hypothetical protein
VRRWQDTASLWPRDSQSWNSNVTQTVRCRDSNRFDLLDRAIFWETAMVPVIPVPATTIASPSGHHSNTQQQRQTREALDTVTPNSHDNGIPRDMHRNADDPARYSLVNSRVPR